jgi:protein SCO1/2
MKKASIGLMLLLLLAPGSGAEGPEIGIDERLGEQIPLDSLTFLDEQGQPVELRTLFDRPVALALVYYRCPSICTPLLQEMARVADLADVEPGQDYRILTVSFDPDDTPDLAKNKQANMLALLENREVATDDWRFLTGDAENIRLLTESVGFQYARDQNGLDFIHAATLILVSREGQIVRYLNGTRFNPADLELAVVDATEGRARSFMQSIQRLCYSYDPAGRAYVLQINRIVLGVTLLFVAAFGVFLSSRTLFRKGAKSQPTGNA